MTDNKREFSLFEAEENLFERAYNGVSYWQMLRFMVCEGAYSERMEREEVARRNGRKKQLSKFALRLPLTYVRNCLQFGRLKKCDIVCVCDIRKNRPARFLDYWNLPADITALRVNETVHADMLDVTDTYAFAEPYCKGQVHFYLKKLFGKIKIDEQEHIFLQELEKRIREKFGRSVSAQRMESEILHWLEIDKAHEVFFEKFFSKVSCKVMVVVCYYQNQLYSAYRVARKRGIRIIELQHGVISNHEEYWFEDQRGINNYTPDYFLTFGDAHISWTKLLPKTRAISVGFPFQERQINEWNDLKTEDKMVVVYPQAEVDFEKLIDEFADIAVQKGFRVILKLHPLQAVDPTRYYPILVNNKNIEMVAQQDKSIYYWLKLAKHHVMANTTVGLEAVAFSHTNVCIATNVSHLQTKPLLEWGVARGFSTAGELMRLIECPISGDRKDTRNRLWKPNAEQNIQMFFQSLKAQNWPEGNDFVSK